MVLVAPFVGMCGGICVGYAVFPHSPLRAAALAFGITFFAFAFTLHGQHREIQRLTRRR
jgi:hypothetical protein